MEITRELLNKATEILEPELVKALEAGISFTFDYRISTAAVAAFLHMQADKPRDDKFNVAAAYVAHAMKELRVNGHITFGNKFRDRVLEGK